MIDLNIGDVKLEVEKLPICALGILEDKPLKSWKKETKKIGGNIVANKKSIKNFGSKSVADSFASVVKGTNYLKYLKQEFRKPKVLDIYKNFLTEPIRVLNSMAGIGQQAYMTMSKKGNNSAHRIERKGHSNFAIGTGQTLESIGAKIDGFI